MDKKLRFFVYSQNSLNTYKVCPMKFKYKYIDNINWKNEKSDYYDSLKSGRDFHLICERYFSNIPLGILSEKDKFKVWIEKIQNIVPIKKENTYLPEYEIRLNIFGNIVQAKYDLIVIDKNTINIWDWKTEAKKMEKKNLENRMQTIVYMFLAQEVIPKLFDMDIDSSYVKMNYYQPEHFDEPISISYSDEKHDRNKNKILSIIDMIQKTEFNKSSSDNKDITEEKLTLTKNTNGCKYCEFNKLCNGKEVDYDNLEDEIYGA